MKTISVLLVAVGVAMLAQPSAAVFMAGAARVNCTMPTGVPLAGYNHGPRRVPDWPVPQETEYTTFMMPSVGHLDWTYCRTLVISDGKESFAFMSIDAIGSDGGLRERAYNIAKDQGFTTPFANFMTHGSHTHSGPGALSPALLWALAPATDLLVPAVRQEMAEKMASSLVEAQANMKPAHMGIGIGQLFNVTRNRRANISPYVNTDSIDPNLGIIRVDDASTGKPIATVWNFAIHGTCGSADNMKSSADIMGAANIDLEAKEDVGIAMFINGDAGDIAPGNGMCDGAPISFAGGPIIAAKVREVRKSVKASPDVKLEGHSQVVNFGKTNMNITLERFFNCSSGGPLDVCTICKALDCDLNVHLGSEYLEIDPQFNAVKFTIADKTTVLVTMPGEPLSELGFQVRDDMKKMGFDQTLLAGYSQNHMGYFCTPDEYVVGGYESQLTFWGIDTAEYIRGNVSIVAKVVA